MTYSEDMYQLSLTDSTREETARQILSYKSHRWLYEREWRLFKQEPGRLNLAGNCVSHVFVGDRMKRPQIAKLKSRLKLRKIPISQMQLDGYSVAFQRV